MRELDVNSTPTNTDVDSTARNRQWRAVLALILCAFFVRATVSWIARDAEPWNDQVTYVQRAHDLLDGKGYTGSYQSWVRHEGERQLQNLPRYPGAYQAPGYPAFIATLMGVFGRAEVVVKIAQVLLGAATTWLVYLLGRNAYGHRVGLAAGWFFALDPTFVAFTHYLFTETLFVFLFVLTLHLLTRSRGVQSLVTAIAIGVLFALATYVKSSVLYLMPVLGFWFVWRRRELLKPALIFVGVTALAWCATIAPWTIRNLSVHGGFVLVDSSGPFNLWRGNQPMAYAKRRAGSDWNRCFPPPFHMYVIAPVADVGGNAFVEVASKKLGVEQPTDLQVMEGGTLAALQFIREDPLWSIQRAWYKIVDVWNPTSFVMRHLHKGGYGPLSKRTEAVISAACALSYLVVLVFALPAMWLRRRDPFTVLVLILIGYYTAIHAVTFGLTRFRLPVMPFLMVLAGVGLVQFVDSLRSRGARAA